MASTVGVLMGANRSLTTLLGAMMALHPEATVLNHGIARIFADPARNFVRDPRQETLDAFVTEAHAMALGGQRGDYGGHILHSHAFDDEALRQAFLDRFGWEAKPHSKALVWKDATKFTKYVLEHRVNLDAVGRSLPALRFMMMVRNPVDITISSIKKGYSLALVGPEKKDSFIDVFVHMIRLFAGFSGAIQRNPEQCRFVFQDELLDRDHLVGLCHFLDLTVDDGWLGDVDRLIRLRPSYPIEETRKQELKAIVARIIPDPAIAGRVADQIV